MPGTFSAQSASRRGTLRRGQAHLFTVVVSTFGLTGPLAAQGLPRTVRVSTIGGVGTPRSLSVSVDRAWRLIDLADHRLLCEGVGLVEWHFRLSRDGRVSVQSEGEIRSVTDSSSGS